MSHTKEALIEVRSIRDAISAWRPDAYAKDRVIYDRADYFVDNIEQARHFTPVSRVKFFLDLDSGCQNMQALFLDLMVDASGPSH